MSTPIYAATVIATGIVPDGYPDAAATPVRYVAVEFPGVRIGLESLDPRPVALTVASARLPLSAQTKQPAPIKRRRSSRALPPPT